ncbi:MAG: hypothetical protein JST19_15555 [Bacteroidetes bacterium]|nr:hypothetical protein [Bacteroidota bacterium]
MQKTVKSNTAASNVLRYLLHLIGLGLFFGLLIYSTNKFWLPFLVKHLTKVYYVAPESYTTELALLLVIYTLFCYFVNNFVLGLYEKGKTKQLLYSMLADYLLLPLSIFILILYYSKVSKTNIEDTSHLYNIYLMTVLLLIKEVITARLLSGKKTIAKTAR